MNELQRSNPLPPEGREKDRANERESESTKVRGWKITESERKGTLFSCKRDINCQLNHDPTSDFVGFVRGRGERLATKNGLPNCHPNFCHISHRIIIIIVAHRVRCTRSGEKLTLLPPENGLLLAPSLCPSKSLSARGWRTPHGEFLLFSFQKFIFLRRWPHRFDRGDGWNSWEEDVPTTQVSGKGSPSLIYVSDAVDIYRT